MTGKIQKETNKHNFLSGMLSFCILTAFGWNPLSNAQEESGASWLPKALADPYFEAIQAVSNYVLTREGCEVLLEAKLSETAASGNPKFILTCADRAKLTTSFVYWLSDVDSNFATDHYPEKLPEANTTQTLTESQRQLKLLIDNSELIASCKQQLQNQLGERLVVMNENAVSVSQRGKQPVNIAMEYQVGKGEFAPKFSAVCRLDSFNSLNLKIFPRP